MKNFLSNKNIGVIQGRLVPRETNKYQSFPFKNWKKEFKYLNQMRVKKLEWVFDSKNFKKNPIFFSKGLKLIKLNMKKFNIKIPSITIDYFMEQPFYKKKYYNQKKKILNNLETLFNNCKKIGIRYLVLPILEKSTLSNKKEETILITEILKLLPIIKKNKQIILFEIDMHPLQTLKFIKKFNHRYFGINYDSGNSAGLDYNLRKEKRYFKYVKNIHLKDKIKKGGTVSLGKGNANLKLLFEIFKKSKYKGNFILQTARSRKNQINEIEKNLKYIKNLSSK